MADSETLGASALNYAGRLLKSRFMYEMESFEIGPIEGRKKSFKASTKRNFERGNVNILQWK